MLRQGRERYPVSPLTVENLSAYLDWADADLSEIEFLNTLVQRAGCSLLVDVNNLYVNA